MKYWYGTANNGLSEIIESEESPLMLSRGGRFSMLSCAYPSLEELKKGLEIADQTCSYCHSPVKLTWYEPTKSELIEKGLCFSCNFWDKRLKSLQDKNVMVFGDSYLTVGEENSTSYFRGYGGAKFKFLKNGEIIESTNVWSSGSIPPHWKQHFPDNCIIIK